MSKRQSTESWNCSSCTYENTEEQAQCQMCGVANLLKSTNKRVNKMIELKEEEPVIQCPACTYINKLTNSKCEVCDAIIFQGDQKHAQHQTVLIDCPHCGFKNDVTNSVCGSCEQLLNHEQQYQQQDLEMEKQGSFSICKYCGCEVGSYIITRHIKECKESQLMLEKMRQQNPEQFTAKQCMYCYEKIQIDLDDHYKICKTKIQYFNDKQSFGQLSPLQTTAIKFMYDNSEKQHYAAKARITKKIQSLGFKIKDVQALHHYIENYAPIIVHIHVSKYMQFFVKDTHYRNQFETNTSSGSLSNSSRTQWENRMFNHKYSKASGFERVKYGTVNLTNDPLGVQCCTSYGNSYFLLKEHVRKRCTFTDMDSSSPSAQIGVFKYGFHVLQRLTQPQIKAIVEGAKAMQVSSSVVSSYKQIQIHGSLQFSKDIERLYVNEIELQDPKMLDLVKQFSAKHKVQYEIFKPRSNSVLPIFGAPTGLFSGSFAGKPFRAPKTKKYR